MTITATSSAPAPLRQRDTSYIRRKLDKIKKRNNELRRRQVANQQRHIHNHRRRSSSSTMVYSRFLSTYARQPNH
jgi:hypothetical protein